MDSFREDEFDKIPDPIILLILNQISDTRTLTHCRTVSKRFNSLVPQVETLLVKVDCVVSTTPSESGDWSSLLRIIRSIFQSLQDLLTPPRSKFSNSPTEILRGFEKIKRLEIELPSGDLKLERGVALRWRAEFGKSLKSCVILAVRSIEYGGGGGGGGDDRGDEIDFLGDGSGGLKLRVVWTISSLIAASTRHYLLREVIKEHEEIESLVLSDREKQGKVVMDQQGLREFRVYDDGGGGGGGGGGVDLGTSTVGWKNRTVVPAVRMRMRHEPKLELACGVRMRGATLVVVRPAGTDEPERRKNRKSEMEERQEDRELASGSFDGAFGEAVEALVKRRSYLLEMNSF